MDTVQNLIRLLTYDEWANREALASLTRAGSPPARSLKLMAHIIAAEWLWLDRLNRTKGAPAVWPDWTLDECEEGLAALSPLRREYVDKLALPLLSERVAYTNSQGEAWENTVEDILTHVVMHSVYHRGQIASDLRASGHTPAYTDYIHSIREGFVE